MTVRDQLIACAKADLAWLERRHQRWEAETQARTNPRPAWWLDYSAREMCPALFRLEQLLEPTVDVRDPAPTQEVTMPDVHDLPAIGSDDKMHVMDRTCWCRPEVLKGPEGGDDLIVHQEIEWVNEGQP